jgi:hypothetical protein
MSKNENSTKRHLQYLNILLRKPACRQLGNPDAHGIDMYSKNQRLFHYEDRQKNIADSKEQPLGRSRKKHVLNFVA